jgi:AcrR family transcriptional regulator
MARPRVFDVDKAIDTATELFWRYGYDRTSLSDLTEAMGITPPSFYFAFGSKEALFWKVLDRYQTNRVLYLETALREPKSRDVVKTILDGYVNGHTDPAHPPGCLGVNSALPCSGTNDPVRTRMIDIRKKIWTTLRDRFERARSEGDLPPQSDPGTLARYVQSIGWGMAFEAQSGATRDDLRRMAALVLDGWPAGTPPAAKPTAVAKTPASKRRQRVIPLVAAPTRR